MTVAASAGSGGVRVLLDELREVLVERSIRYGDFTLASGAKSRYYCDTKLTVLTPRGAALIGEAMVALLRPYDVEAAGGLAMGAAYLATAVAIGFIPPARNAFSSPASSGARCADSFHSGCAGASAFTRSIANRTWK